MSYRLVQQWQQKAMDVAHSCRVLSVSRSGYYAWQRRLQDGITLSAQDIHIKSAFAASAHSYGSRRLQKALQQRGLSIGRYRVRTLMKRHGLRARWKRKFIHTTDSRHDLPVADNVLARRFNPETANQAWVADITYIRTSTGWLYLAAVMDLHSRKIIGWAMAPNMPAELVCSALQMAIAQRQPSAGCLMHTDRGSQYASAAHQAILAQHGLVGSMSGKGCCWDNAVMERFFLNLKMERVWQRQYDNHREAMIDISDYIVSFYNAIRLHSTLGYLSPNLYEQHQTEKQAKQVSEIS